MVDQVTRRMSPEPKKTAYLPFFIQQNRNIERIIFQKFQGGFEAFFGVDAE
jgi:hypothetical protein